MGPKQTEASEAPKKYVAVRGALSNSDTGWRAINQWIWLCTEV